jgi:hypothetical protein
VMEKMTTREGYRLRMDSKTLEDLQPSGSYVKIMHSAAYIELQWLHRHLRM